MRLILYLIVCVISNDLCSFPGKEVSGVCAVFWSVNTVGISEMQVHTTVPLFVKLLTSCVRKIFLWACQITCSGKCKLYMYYWWLRERPFTTGGGDWKFGQNWPHIFSDPPYKEEVEFRDRPPFRRVEIWWSPPPPDSRSRIHYTLACDVLLMCSCTWS